VAADPNNKVEGIFFGMPYIAHPGAYPTVMLILDRADN
jgi:hypothetical protein